MSPADVDSFVIDQSLLNWDDLRLKKNRSVSVGWSLSATRPHLVGGIFRFCFVQVNECMKYESFDKDNHLRHCFRGVSCSDYRDITRCECVPHSCL